MDIVGGNGKIGVAVERRKASRSGSGLAVVGGVKAGRRRNASRSGSGLAVVGGVKAGRRRNVSRSGSGLAVDEVVVVAAGEIRALRPVPARDSCAHVGRHLGGGGGGSVGRHA